MAVRLPRLGFVGPMLGSNPGWVVGQGEVVAGLLGRDGYEVRTASRIPNRWLRLLDVATSPLRWRGRIDLLVVMVFSGPGFRLADAASAAARRLGIPVVLWLHGGNLPAWAEESPRRLRRVRRVFERAAARVAPSEFLAGYFRGWGFDVRVVPNVVDIGRYAYRHRPNVAGIAPRLLWMRTFHDLYNPFLAVETLAELCRTHSGATLTLAGQDRGLLRPTEELAARLGLSASVRFAGFLNAEGKAREFPRHDVFLNTNRVDNTPVSVIEAAAYGLPVVATRVGGISHLLRDGETGLLVPDGDAPAMAAAVRRLLAEPGLSGRLSAGGRRLAESCAWESVRDRWSGLFREVLR